MCTGSQAGERQFAWLSKAAAQVFQVLEMLHGDVHADTGRVQCWCGRSLFQPGLRRCGDKAEPRVANGPAQGIEAKGG